MNVKNTLQKLLPLEDLIWEHEREFLREFCHNGDDLIGLYFSSECCRFVYLLPEGQHVIDTISANKLDWWLHSIGLYGRV